MPKKTPSQEIHTVREEEEEPGESRVHSWEQERIISRRAQELQETVNMARGLPRSPARKRGGEKDTISTYSPSKKTRKSTKKKYPLLGDDWVLVETSETPPKHRNPHPWMVANTTNHGYIHPQSKL